MEKADLALSFDGCHGTPKGDNTKEERTREFVKSLSARERWEDKELMRTEIHNQKMTPLLTHLKTSKNSDGEEC